MIMHQTLVYTPDNSGAVVTKCIRIQKRSVRLGALPGQTCIAVLKKIWPKKLVNVKKSKILKKGQVVRCLILRTVRGLRRWGNFFLKASKNAGLLLGQYNDPYATRVYGVIFMEIKTDKRFKAICRLGKVIC